MTQTARTPAASPDVEPAQPLAERIRMDIITGAFLPGQRLRLAELCALYGTGASPLREVLSGLAAERLLVQSVNRGFRTPDESPAELRDILALRRQLETAAARDSVRAGGVAWEEGLVLAHRRLKRLGREEDVASRGARGADAQDWEQKHRAFHQALIAACPSEWTRRFCATLMDQFGRYRRHYRPPGDVQADLSRQHDQIVEAAVERDAEGCAALVAAHIDLTGATVLAQIAPG